MANYYEPRVTIFWSAEIQEIIWKDLEGRVTQISHNTWTSPLVTRNAVEAWGLKDGQWIHWVKAGSFTPSDYRGDPQELAVLMLSAQRVQQ